MLVGEIERGPHESGLDELLGSGLSANCELVRFVNFFYTEQRKIARHRPHVK